ncbi:MAG: rod shape-determining protein MreD [Clostridia bacterium]|nr:rod shape-determining protein MreD [Clostridia bacterium]
MKRFLIPIFLVISLYLDSILFHHVNIFGTRPDAVLAVVISCSVLTGSVKGGIAGLCAGLFADIFFGEYVGLYALIYMLSGMLSGLLEGKFYSDNIVIAPLCALGASFIKENIMAFSLSLDGGRFNYGSMLITYILPCAVLTGLFCMLIHIILKPSMSRQVRQRVDYRIGG